MTRVVVVGARRGGRARVARGGVVAGCRRGDLLLAQNIGEQSDQARTRGKDAFWLGHAWVDGRRTDADVDQLATMVAGTGIRDLYVHTGPLEHDGSLRDDLAPRAQWFVDAVHAKLPGIRVQSWLGDVVQPEFDGLDVESAQSRERVVASARRVLAYGFDGVHYDLEPVRSGSPGFLALLDATRAVTSAARVPLSVSAPVIDPLPGLHSVGLAVADHGNGGAKPISPTWRVASTRWR
ncbi:hypothetical protein ACFU44_08635 [Nocardia rhizosphaerihabitans]|uniref:hypothetical protein n=1 Tax=Nocardia rhizosphaerihabitans TaxID=1691570 RepID=UPI003672D679